MVNKLVVPVLFFATLVFLILFNAAYLKENQIKLNKDQTTNDVWHCQVDDTKVMLVGKYTQDSAMHACSEFKGVK